MTKKEIAQFEELRRELRLANAFHRTAPVLPDVPPPESYGDKLSIGFFPWAHGDYPRVEEACSSAHFHATGRTDKTTSQRAVYLYSSRILAWKSIRHQVENQCAEKLARIDLEIEKLIAAEPADQKGD